VRFKIAAALAGLLLVSTMLSLVLAEGLLACSLRDRTHP
jgi:hypothetical protein